MNPGFYNNVQQCVDLGKGSARSNSVSPPASAESAVTSDTSVVNGAADCSPSPVAVLEVLDQPALLLQSLRRVCAAAGNTGLTAKEAVAKIMEQGLPGLNEGGERLIVQVAKSFRGSAAFVEERGRYFMQEPSFRDYGISVSDTGNSISKRQKAARASDEASEIETAIEAAKQLQNLQSIQEIVGVDEVGFKGGEGQATAERMVGPASRSKTGVKVGSSSREQSGPRCNRDDGKGWRCFRPAESGFSLCKYHRDQIRRAEVRRRRLKNKAKEHSPVRPSNPTPKEVVKAKTDQTVDPRLVESDDEMPDQKRRRGVKAKSLKSIL